MATARAQSLLTQSSLPNVTAHLLPEVSVHQRLRYGHQGAAGKIPVDRKAITLIGGQRHHALLDLPPRDFPLHLVALAIHPNWFAHPDVAPGKW